MNKILIASIVALALSSSNLLAMQKQIKIEEEIRKVIKLERKTKKKIFIIPKKVLDRFVEIPKTMEK